MTQTSKALTSAEIISSNTVKTSTSIPPSNATVTVTIPSTTPQCRDEDCQCNGGECIFNTTLGRCHCHCQESVYGDSCVFGQNNTNPNIDTGAIPIRQLEALCKEADPLAFKKVQIKKLTPGSVVAESVAEYNYLNNETQIHFVNNELDGVLTNILKDTSNLNKISRAFDNASVQLYGLIFQSPEIKNITDLKPFVNCSRFANYTAEISNGQWQCVGPCKTNPDYCHQHGECVNDIHKGPICLETFTTPTSQESSTTKMSSPTEPQSTSVTMVTPTGTTESVVSTATLTTNELSKTTNTDHSTRATNLPTNTEVSPSSPSTSLPLTTDFSQTSPGLKSKTPTNPDTTQLLLSSQETSSTKVSSPAEPQSTSFTTVTPTGTTESKVSTSTLFTNEVTKSTNSDHSTTVSSPTNTEVSPSSSSTFPPISTHMNTTQIPLTITKSTNTDRTTTFNSPTNTEVSPSSSSTFPPISTHMNTTQIPLTSQESSTTIMFSTTEPQSTSVTTVIPTGTSESSASSSEFPDKYRGINQFTFQNPNNQHSHKHNSASTKQPVIIYNNNVLTHRDTVYISDNEVSPSSSSTFPPISTHMNTTQIPLTSQESSTTIMFSTTEPQSTSVTTVIPTGTSESSASSSVLTTIGVTATINTDHSTTPRNFPTSTEVSTSLPSRIPTTSTHTNTTQLPPSSQLSSTTIMFSPTETQSTSRTMEFPNKYRGINQFTFQNPNNQHSHKHNSASTKQPVIIYNNNVLTHRDTVYISDNGNTHRNN
ncbi:uncharacterized protein PB18E9.04c-like [Thunnus albacares]|uniref:uncharacterized protein PB18E9.04c-like n=1 Tax=Thunnus albacares TaxID=8236 RepID=UPI001CF631A6|nr:uncharacterized protein PB18E9.04c-like [Thunnus albacares]